MIKFKIETNTLLNHLDRSWTVVENALGHKRNSNGILRILCREHFTGLIEYDRVTGPTYSFYHYDVALDEVDRDSRDLNNKVELVKQEMWLSLPRKILFNTLHILEIMYGYIIFVCRISQMRG
jgi:hypothetical protein